MKPRLREEQLHALQQLADKEGVSLHDMVLRAIDHHLGLPAQPVTVRTTTAGKAGCPET